MKQKFFLFCSVLFFLLSACGSGKELEEYKSNMEIFYSDISEYDSIINSLDATSESSVQELLHSLDSLEERFAWMASLTVPEEFSSIEPLAAEASQYMSDAVSLYHQAYESASFDTAAFETATAYYKEANNRILTILAILRGELSEGD